MTTIPYRPQIDGLRAIAVAAVILFHANPRLVPGGFLGVDIFFVISGYLITALIMADLAAGTFSYLGFYERRARRILPVLLVVLAATLPFAALYLLPMQQLTYARSVLATLLFSSNILFWQETGYFMAEADLKPLLHTWSLAVEEQFYLLYPLLLGALWRFGSRLRIGIIGLIFVASLIASMVLAAHAPGANFYLLTSRAWELLAGAALAMAMGQVKTHSRFAGLFDLTGLAMVAGSLALFSAQTPMPSLWGLIPVGGTVLLIAFATHATPLGRVLALPPLVRIGRISYSAYLWHWPILVFARLRFGDALGPVPLTGLIGATFLLSYLSWRFVEQPFRYRGAGAPVPVRAFLAVLITVGVALVALTQVNGLRVVGKAGLTTAAADLTTSAGVEAKIAVNFGLGQTCETAFTLSPDCRTSDTPEVLLWGDSFAMHLAPAINAGVGSRGMVQHTKSVCAPIVDISVVTPEYPAAWSDGCIAFNDQVLDWLSDQPSIRYVVISSPFGIVFNDVYQRGGQIAAAPRPDLVRDKLIATAARVAEMGKTLIIVSPPPVTGENIGQCLAGAALRGAPADACDFTTDQIDPLSAKVFDFLHEVSSQIPVLFLDQLTCANGVCDTRIGEVFIYRDGGHLSIEAARYLGEERAFYHRIQQVAEK